MDSTPNLSKMSAYWFEMNLDRSAITIDILPEMIPSVVNLDKPELVI